MLTRELHSYATQRANPRHGAGKASLDIHALLMIAALAFLLHDDDPFRHFSSGFTAALFKHRVYPAVIPEMSEAKLLESSVYLSRWIPDAPLAVWNDDLPGSTANAVIPTADKVLALAIYYHEQ